MVFTALQINV